jgi:hypothetical protein
MRLAPWLILPLLLVTGCHWKGDGSDEFIRDPFQRKSTSMQTGTGRLRDFGVPEQQVPRRDGRADLQMVKSGGPESARPYDAVNVEHPRSPPPRPLGRRP